MLSISQILSLHKSKESKRSEKLPVQQPSKEITSLDFAGTEFEFGQSETNHENHFHDL